MKIRVTILTEKDIENPVSKEWMEKTVKDAWQRFLDSICAGSDHNDKSIVESCEVVEE